MLKEHVKQPRENVALAVLHPHVVPNKPTVPVTPREDTKKRGVSVKAPKPRPGRVQDLSAGECLCRNCTSPLGARETDSGEEVWVQGLCRGAGELRGEGGGRRVRQREEWG